MGIVVSVNQSLPQSISELARTLTTRAGIRLWQSASVLSVRGDDRLTWLNGQITNDVRKLATHGSVHALAVNVRGKIMAEVWVTEVGDEFRLLVAESALAPLVESLEHFIIMEDVTLAPLPELGVCSLEGPEAQSLAAEVDASGCHAFECDVLGIGGQAWMGTHEQLAKVVAQLETHAKHISPEAYELVRLRLARPRFGIDYDLKHYPQEAGLKGLVSFQKGCYLGQEVVCTLESRGRLSKHLCALTGEAGATPLDLAPATDLHLVGPGNGNSAEPAGTITSASWDPDTNAIVALGYVRRAHAQPGTAFFAGEAALKLIKQVGEDDLGSAAPASA
jgi:folate-binding protein YgfZ